MVSYCLGKLEKAITVSPEQRPEEMRGQAVWLCERRAFQFRKHLV